MAKKSLKVNAQENKSIRLENIIDAEFAEDHMLI